MPTPSTATPHTVVRLDIPTGQPFDQFRAAYERAVPDVDLDRVMAIASSGGTWAEVEQAAAEDAPHGFMLYATMDTTPAMKLAGHTISAVEYLMGNHVLAERMFRHHPAAMLYAPLRVLLHSDDHDHAVLVIDQPSTVFSSLGRPEIDAVANDLDRKLAALLRNLHVEVPKSLAG